MLVKEYMVVFVEGEHRIHVEIAFEREVDSVRREEGWKLQGGVSISVTDDGGDKTYHYAQALEREFDEEKEEEDGV